MHEPNLTLDKVELRKALRQARRLLDSKAQDHAEKRVLSHLLSLRTVREASSIACYLHADGELNTDQIIKYLQTAGKEIYLPRLVGKTADKAMEFERFEGHGTLIKNRFGIREPSRCHKPQDPALFDLVLMPVVGFDLEGNRLGMGGGYYDRSFSFCNDTHQRRPALIGLAHHFQACTRIPSEPWDISLDAVVTDHEALCFNHDIVL